MPRMSPSHVICAFPREKFTPAIFTTIPLPPFVGLSVMVGASAAVIAPEAGATVAVGAAEFDNVVGAIAGATVVVAATRTFDDEPSATSWRAAAVAAFTTIVCIGVK